VLIPGDPERLSRAERIKNGVPVDEETWRELTVAARGVNVLVESPQATPGWPAASSRFSSLTAGTKRALVAKMRPRRAKNLRQISNLNIVGRTCRQRNFGAKRRARQRNGRGIWHPASCLCIPHRNQPHNCRYHIDL